MQNTIASVPQLEACLGVASLGVKMKIIDHLDRAAARWIAASPIACLGLAGEAGPQVTLMGGSRGFAEVADPATLTISGDAIDQTSGLQPGQGAGVLFLIPGIGETLRANGRVRAVGDTIEIAIEECFVHCAKALIRSDFWTGTSAPPPPDAAAAVDASRFLALVTMDREGRIDVSPKGDPAGLLIRSNEGRATLAERPGNRLAFGYRNMIDQPLVAAVCMIPGSTSVVQLQGRAHLTSDEDIRSTFVVDGKTPILGTVIDGAQPVLGTSRALERAGLWSVAQPAPEVDPAETFVAHVKLNKARGAQATLLRLAVNRGLIAKGLATNYRTDLY